jgi:hypothetical protein
MCHHVIVYLVIAAASACGPGNESSNFALKREKATPFQAASTQKNCPDGKTVSGKIKFFKKIGETWCWASSGEMVSDYFDRRIKQCDQVQEFCGANCEGVDCCKDPVPKQCVIGGVPTLDRHGFQVTTHPGPLRPDEIVNELGCKDRPFIYTWDSSGGGGHMMVAIDFLTGEDGVDYVITHDPDGGKAIPIPYDIYRTGDFKHGDALVGIEKVTQ